MISQIEFTYPWLLLLLPLPILVYRFVPAYRTKEIAIKVPFFSLVLHILNEPARVAASLLTAEWWQKVTLMFTWILVVLSLSKPTLLGEEQVREEFGRDVMIVVDLSGSMAEADFYLENGQALTRLEAAKQVLNDFAKQRENDRLGLILFGDSAFLQTPFTADKSVWTRLLNESDVAMAGQSTNLGDAIGLGLKIFEQSEMNQQDKMMIVLTDGNDTGSFVEPIDAAKIAAQKGVKIYMVALGDPNTVGEQALDMETIKRVSSLTGAQAFTALNQHGLTEAYTIIDQLEPQKYNHLTYRPKVSLHHYFIALVLIIHVFVFAFLLMIRFYQQNKSNARSLK